MVACSVGRRLLRPLRRSIGGGLAALALAGCASTVPYGVTSTGDSAANGYLNGTGTATSTSSPTGPAGVPTDVKPTGTGPASPGNVSVGPTGSTTLPSTVPSTVSTSSTGSSSSSIEVGITWYSDPTAGLKAIGVQGATLGNQQLYAQVMVDYLNKHGGLDGKTIKPVFFMYNANPGAAPIPQQDAEACQTFTQDNHIQLAIINLAGGVVPCLEKAGIPMLDEGFGTSWPESHYQQYPLDFELDAWNPDRRWAQVVHILQGEGYFTNWNTATAKPGGVTPVKMGVIAYNDPSDEQAVRTDIIPALAHAGYTNPQVAYVVGHDSYADLASMETQLQTVALKFQSAGVNHVIIDDDNGVSTLLFSRAAQNQHYFPRWGITSGNNMNLLVSHHLVSNQNVGGAVGVGWNPAFDTPAGASVNGKYSNAARRACYKIMQSAHATGSGFNEQSADEYCFPFTVLQSRYAAMKGAFTPASFLASMNEMGSRYQSPVVPKIWIGPNRHDGLAGFYKYAFDPGCGCMRYESGVLSLPH